MRPCTALQRSGATCRHRILRSYSSATQPLQHKHDATREQAPESFQIDQDGKTVKTAVGDLPLSPVMDPGFWEARGRYKQEKPKPGKPRNVFEREFQKNPFGERICLLQPFDRGLTQLQHKLFLRLSVSTMSRNSECRRISCRTSTSYRIPRPADPGGYRRAWL